jgi:pre-rRNA-processing protein TSR3
MVRHKKDGFSKGKKYSNAPHHRPQPRNEDGEPSSKKPSFKAACWDLEHCDPKRCSGKRLMHFGQMRELSVGQKFSGVVISYEFEVQYYSSANNYTDQMLNGPFPQQIES